MKTLMKALRDLKIKGTPKEERQFRSFIEQTLNEMRDEEIAVLKELKKRHVNSLKHSLLVARDTAHIARALRYPEGKVKALRLAAALHDAGKVDIHEAILDLSGREEKEIWQSTHPGSVLQEGEYIRDAITVKDAIEYKSRKAKKPEQYAREFEKWMKDKNQLYFLHRPIMEYLRYHQIRTREILGRIGVSPEIIDFAAGHHPEYFSEKEKLPRECIIIAIADKFNAIIQSEGVRNYIPRKSRVIALNIIADKIKQEFASGFFKSFEKEVLGLMIKKYLPDAVKNEVIPRAERIISSLKNLPGFRIAKYPLEIEEAERIMAVIAVTLALCREFRGILDKQTMRDLKSHLEYLKARLKVE